MKHSTSGGLSVDVCWYILTKLRSFPYRCYLCSHPWCIVLTLAVSIHDFLGTDSVTNLVCSWWQTEDLSVQFLKHGHSPLLYLTFNVCFPAKNFYFALIPFMRSRNWHLLGLELQREWMPTPEGSAVDSLLKSYLKDALGTGGEGQGLPFHKHLVLIG